MESAFRYCSRLFSRIFERACGGPCGMFCLDAEGRKGVFEFAMSTRGLLLRSQHQPPTRAPLYYECTEPKMTLPVPYR